MKSISLTPEKNSRRTVPGSNDSQATTPATKDHGHTLASKLL
ncbi:MAG TPA: hypothetical protein VK869_04190 [Rubrobacteraceae bacterium]|nr:hypothetical protein [Rubrobacteraceae bacterium]